MNQGFSTVLMPLAKSIRLFQTLNITSNEPGCVSGVTSRSRISFSGLGKREREGAREEENRSRSWIGSSSDSKFSSQPESFRLADGILGDTSLLIGFFKLWKHGVGGYRILQRIKTTRGDINLLDCRLYNEATGTLVHEFLLPLKLRVSQLCSRHIDNLPRNDDSTCDRSR